jgi:hypothetical protein
LNLSGWVVWKDCPAANFRSKKMKKGDTYFVAIFDGEETPIVTVWKYIVTTVNRNGIYLRCQEKYLEHVREHLRPGRFPKDAGFRTTKEKAKRAIIPKMKEEVNRFETNPRILELYPKEERERIIKRLKQSITKIKKK